MMFLAGMRLRHFVALFSLVIGALAVIAVSAPYRLARLTSFLNPWERPFDTGYQLTQSLIAFGRGGWFGVGLGKSIQKMFYLPEAHTDFLFAVIAEELGLLGMLVVIGLIFVVSCAYFYDWSCSATVRQSFCRLSRLWVWVVDCDSIYRQYWRKFRAVPTKGLTLPLMSYGGSSVLVNCIVIAVLLRIDHENRLTLG